MSHHAESDFSRRAVDEAQKNQAVFSSSMEHETLSRDHPISEFIRHQKSKLKDLSEEEFTERYESHFKEFSERREDKQSSSKSRHKNDESGEYAISKSPFQGERLTSIVLKFTTLSEANSEAPSFFVGIAGAKIGRDTSNEINVPSDVRLAPVAHSEIQYLKGHFYIIDRGYDFAASVRIGVGGHKNKWVIEEGSQFSAGNSVFRSCGMNDKGDLKVEIVEGPLKGESRIISKQAASTVGRSSENAICVPDKELSRRHSKIEFDRELNKFVVSDYGSTNGTYIQLVGPYGGRLRLNLNDHILVGRTGFSINRYDFGVSEEIGHRQTMEDSCTIVQHLNMSSLCVRDLSPHSFFGVFDGHGGSEASTYLSQNLHINVADGLMRVADDLLSVLENASIWTDMGAKERDLSISHSPGDAKKSSVDSSQISDVSRGGQPLTRNMSSFSLKEKLDCIVMKALKEAFLKTDNDFLTTSNHPQHGSTATIALILGHRLFCPNVGDSRTLLCRNFKPVPMSQDHKPSREDEAQRIRDAGGFIINNRVMGELAVSRAFGDSEFKKGVQSAVDKDKRMHYSRGPSSRKIHCNGEEKGGEGKEQLAVDVESLQLNPVRDRSNSHSPLANPEYDNCDSSPNDRRSESDSGDDSNDVPWDSLVIAEPDIQVTTITENDQFLLVACDGLFDVFTGEDVVKFVRENMLEHGDAQKCCHNLTHEAIKKRHSRDNVSVILIILNKWY